MIDKSIESSTELQYRYCLSENDKMIIGYYTKKPLTSQAEKSLIILSEVFGGLHHLESEQLKMFDFQSKYYNQYLFNDSLATFDSQKLTLLVIMAHDMAVRFEIQPAVLDPTDESYDKKLLEKQYNSCKNEYDLKISFDDFISEYNKQPYLRLLFHERQREGDFSKRHPTIEDTISGYRANNKRYA